MEQIRKKLSKDEMEVMLQKILHYKILHDKIIELERDIFKIQEQKDSLLTDLELSRADETYYLAQLEEKYGPGKLDVLSMDWVEAELEEKIKTEEHDDSIS